ncbi:MAG: RNase adapter RapZ [Clostridia bacterium]|jgi:RNase adapter protein RapZ|nr:RNase adapter RapZ [Clostridia bacterium]MBT7122749.1 RNase adapter RapZ [Clostridia bacterium]
MEFIIVTGLSGAGRSQALKRLEDMGYFCVDNMPPKLIPEFAKICLKNDDIRKAAAVVDMRMGVMFDSVYDAIKKLNDMREIKVAILYLDASDETIVKRFKETRRRHPMSGDNNIVTGITRERGKLKRINDLANIIVDTSTYSLKKLGEVLDELFSDEHEKGILITVTTFGYKRGIPIDADMVFDMRFIPNPFYKEELRALTGMDELVKEYVMSFPRTRIFIDKISELVGYVAPYYLEQDKKQLIIAVGCTGGMHRSVVVAQELYRMFAEQGLRVMIEHRDIKRDLQQRREK